MGRLPEGNHAAGSFSSGFSFEHPGSEAGFDRSQRRIVSCILSELRASFRSEVGMEARNDDQVRAQVREAYAKVARGADGSSVGCCGNQGCGSLALGYTKDDIEAAPEGADLGLGCGNPQAIAALRAGETVLEARGAHGPSHRRRHDAGDGDEGARQCPPRRRVQRGVPARGDRALTGGGRHRRRHHLQLRDQPLARQSCGVPRGVPGLEARRALGDFGRRRDTTDAA